MWILAHALDTDRCTYCGPQDRPIHMTGQIQRAGQVQVAGQVQRAGQIERAGQVETVEGSRTQCGRDN